MNRLSDSESMRATDVDAGGAAIGRENRLRRRTLSLERAASVEGGKWGRSLSETIIASALAGRMCIARSARIVTGTSKLSKQT